MTHANRYNVPIQSHSLSHLTHWSVFCSFHSTSSTPVHLPNRRNQIAKTIREITKIVQDILKEVEVQEPRFISSLNECNGHYEGNHWHWSMEVMLIACDTCSPGLEVISPNEFEVVLYLNQMGVFNFVDDGTLPGCAVLKVMYLYLSIERERECVCVRVSLVLIRQQSNYSCQTDASDPCPCGSSSLRLVATSVPGKYVPVSKLWWVWLCYQSLWHLPLIYGAFVVSGCTSLW